MVIFAVILSQHFGDSAHWNLGYCVQYWLKIMCRFNWNKSGSLCEYAGCHVSEITILQSWECCSDFKLRCMLSCFCIALTSFYNATGLTGTTVHYELAIRLVQVKLYIVLIHCFNLEFLRWSLRKGKIICNKSLKMEWFCNSVHSSLCSSHNHQGFLSPLNTSQVFLPIVVTTVSSEHYPNKLWKSARLERKKAEQTLLGFTSMVYQTIAPYLSSLIKLIQCELSCGIILRTRA